MSLTEHEAEDVSHKGLQSKQRKTLCLLNIEKKKKYNIIRKICHRDIILLKMFLVFQVSEEQQQSQINVTKIAKILKELKMLADSILATINKYEQKLVVFDSYGIG